MPRRIPACEREFGHLRLGAFEVQVLLSVARICKACLLEWPLDLDSQLCLLCNIGALIITYTILGAPYYSYSTMGP